MNHKLAHTLQELFEHPIRLNLKWPAVVSLFNALGEVTVESHDRFRVDIDGHCEVYHPPHRTDLSADDIVKVRKFLELTGHAPGADPREEHAVDGDGSDGDASGTGGTGEEAADGASLDGAAGVSEGAPPGT